MHERQCIDAMQSRTHDAMTKPRRELPYDRETERKKPWLERAFMHGKHYGVDLPKPPRYVPDASGKLRRVDVPRGKAPRAKEP